MSSSSLPISRPILVVEDNPVARKLFRVTLEAEGYRVLEACDGRSALAHLAREVPALVLQDLVLPDYDGFDLSRALRAAPECVSLPIVVMSGFPRLLDRARDEPGCFDASLVKPVAPSLLLEVVRRYLAAPPSTTDTFGAGKTILIVDDDPVQLKLTRLQLSAVGFDVAAAADGPSALARARAAPPDVVLCDVLMPGTDGYELCVALRALPSLARTPIVLVSAHYGGPRDASLASAAGANALVTRSATFHDILDAVRSCLDGQTPAPPQNPDFSRDHADRVIQQLKRQARVNAGAAERSAFQAAQLSVLAGIANALASSDDIDAALEDVLAACLDAAGISCGALFRVDSHGRIELSIASGFSDAAVVDLPDLFGCSQLLALADHGAIAVPREALPRDAATALLERAGVQAAVLVPIMDGRSRVGALFLGTSVAGIDEHDLAVFGRAIGAHIAQAIALAMAFQRLKDSAEASRVLSASLDVGATQASIGRLATAHLAQLCEIQIGDGVPVVYAGASLPEAAAAALAALCQRHPRQAVLLATGSTGGGRRSVVAVSPDDDDEPLGSAAVDDDHRGLWRALRVSARVVVPLVVGDHHLGTIAFARVQGSRDFCDVDILALEDLAQRAAIAIDNARLYAAARDANRAKDEFLATVSHELRSPLNAMLGWAQLLAGGLSASRHDKAVRAIERNAVAQAALIDDLLDMSRIVSGTMRLELEDLELAPIVDAVVESLRPQIDAQGLVLRPIRTDGSTRLVGDPGRLHQIVGNLLSNSIKFTPAGGSIDIAVVETADGMTLTITDDGQGIDPRFLAHVFERFKQADGSTSRAHGGLGLGLAITKHLVELHGGSIHAHSDGTGRGARFTVALRRSAAAVASPASERSRPAGPRPTNALEGLSILVVDDELDTREMSVSLLEQHGAMTRAVGCAADALRAIAAHPPDVLLSDLGMPDEDGYSLIRKVRDLPSGATLPAIAISGFAGADDRRRAIAAGFQVHLAKPVRLAELLSAIANFARPPR